jgi:hypothetical protein
LPRRILGAFISVVVAWVCLQFVMLVVFALERRPFPLWVDAVYFAVASFPFVFIPGALVFVPLYVFISPHSILWRWPLCTACGFLFGGVLMYMLGFPHPNTPDWLAFTVLAAMTGGVTCFFAAITMRRYHCAQAI